MNTPETLKNKLKVFNNLVRNGNQVGVIAYLDQNENDVQFLRAVKLQSALIEGFEQGKNDMIEIIKKLTTNPN